GSTEYNLALGNRRAEAVLAFLTGFGLSGDRFETVSFGEGRPLRTGTGEEVWTANRRGESVITAGANAINPASCRYDPCGIPPSDHSGGGTHADHDENQMPRGGPRHHGDGRRARARWLRHQERRA